MHVDSVQYIDRLITITNEGHYMTYEPTATKRYQYRRAGLVTIKSQPSQPTSWGGFALIVILTAMLLLPALLGLN